MGSEDKIHTLCLILTFNMMCCLYSQVRAGQPAKRRRSRNRPSSQRQHFHYRPVLPTVREGISTMQEDRDVEVPRYSDWDMAKWMDEFTTMEMTVSEANM